MTRKTIEKTHFFGKPRDIEMDFYVYLESFIGSVTSFILRGDAKFGIIFYRHLNTTIEAISLVSDKALEETDFQDMPFPGNSSQQKLALKTLENWVAFSKSGRDMILDSFFPEEERFGMSVDYWETGAPDKYPKRRHKPLDYLVYRRITRDSLAFLLVDGPTCHPSSPRVILLESGPSEDSLYTKLKLAILGDPDRSAAAIANLMSSENLYTVLVALKRVQELIGMKGLGGFDEVIKMSSLPPELTDALIRCCLKHLDSDNMSLWESFDQTLRYTSRQDRVAAINKYATPETKNLNFARNLPFRTEPGNFSGVSGSLFESSGSAINSFYCLVSLESIGQVLSYFDVSST